MFGFIPGLHQLEASSLPTRSAVANSSISRHWQVSPGSQNLPWLKITSVYIAFYSLKLDLPTIRSSFRFQMLTVLSRLYLCTLRALYVHNTLPTRLCPVASVLSLGLSLDVWVRWVQLSPISPLSMNGPTLWSSGMFACLHHLLDQKSQDVRDHYQVTHQCVTTARNLFDTQ